MGYSTNSPSATSVGGGSGSGQNNALVSYYLLLSIILSIHNTIHVSIPIYTYHLFILYRCFPPIMDRACCSQSQQPVGRMISFPFPPNRSAPAILRLRLQEKFVDLLSLSTITSNRSINQPQSLHNTTPTTITAQTIPLSQLPPPPQ